MCMYLTAASEEKTNKLVHKAIYEGKEIVAYKILREDGFSYKTLVSPFFSYSGPIWQLGRVACSDRRANIFQDTEDTKEVINHGIHCILTRQEARFYKKNLGCDISNLKLVKVLINPDDVVAVGETDYNRNLYPSIVATKVMPVAIVR